MMKRKFVIGFVSLAILGISLIVVYDYIIIEQNELRNPGNLSSYSNVGSFKIDSETILTALDLNRTNIFSPIIETPSSDSPPPSNTSVAWTQNDYLKITSALGQLIWDDQMSLKDWSVEFVMFGASCKNIPEGFFYANFTFFKTIEVEGKKLYTTRHIRINPIFNNVSWGSEAFYEIPILRRWNGIDLTDVKVDAEDALRIAEEFGGKEIRLQANNDCTVTVSSSLNKHRKWSLEYSVIPEFDAKVNMDSGTVEVVGGNK